MNGPAHLLASTLLLALLGCRGTPARTSAAPAPASSAAAPANLRFLLDSFELETAQNGVAWQAAGDSNNLGTHAEFAIVEGGAGTNTSAARFFGHLGKNEAPWPWASFGLNLTSDWKPLDISAVMLVRFWARGDGKTYKISIHKDAAKDFANYEYSFTAPSDWKLFEVPISEFKQPRWGKPVPRVFDDSRSVSFAPTQAGRDFELFVDDLELEVDPQKPFPWKSAAFAGAPQQLELAELVKKRIDYQPVSLAAVANRSLADQEPGDGKGGWTDQGTNSLLGFPTGQQTFHGIPFSISDKAGKQALVLRGKNAASLPTRAEIPVGKKGKAVYFLHASAWGSEANGSYEITYADGSSETIALRDKVEIFDFWNPDASPFARTAWRGKNPQKDGIGVTLFAWKNPHPDKAIRSIIAATPGHGAYLGVIGVTVASDGPYLTPAPLLRLDDKTWFPYAGVSVAERRGTALDASALLEAPAGKHGVLRRQGENFVFADGKKTRFWGMSITDQMNFPSKEQADFLAEFCAQLGFNMTRHHLMDAAWSKYTIFGNDKDDTQTVDAARLDQFDYLIAKLIERGIYINLDFIAQRKPLAKDGVHEPDKVEPGYKMVGEFDEVLINNQERFVRQLLTHKNPYTGKTYADDPAIVMTSITNESSLFFLGDAGQGELKSGYHRELLKKLYNEWLAKKFGARDKLEARWAPAAEEAGKAGLKAEEDPTAASVAPIYDFSDRTREYEQYSRARVLDNYTFLYEIESGFHKRLTKAIRAMGYKALVTGTNHWLDQPVHYYVNSLTDWVDGHVYYSIPANGYQYKAGVSFLKDPTVAAEKNIIQDVARRRVGGTPYSISEWSSLQPVFRNDALVQMAAYAGLHNWSPLMYALGGSPFSESDQAGCKLDNVFELKCQGGILALWPALSRLFHRRDVKESPEAYYRPIDGAELFDPRTRVGLPTGLAYVAKSGMEFVGEKPKPMRIDALLAKYVKESSATSITGELFTDWGKGLFTLDTPRSQGIVGKTDGAKQSVSNLSVRVTNAWATVLATSLDDRPIAKSSHVLISAVGNAVNRGMRLTTSGTAWKRAGTAPVLLEPMLGTVELTALTGDTAELTAYYLSVSGKRLGSVPLKSSAGTASFDMKPEYQTLHYEIVR